jgi:hypothetical protein
MAFNTLYTQHALPFYKQGCFSRNSFLLFFGYIWLPNICDFNYLQEIFISYNSEPSFCFQGFAVADGCEMAIHS